VKRKNLDNRRKLLIFRIEMCRNLYNKPTVCRNVGADLFVGTGEQDIFKKV
jgi:hypothetical protein